ncbi:MAG: NHL repeat-containing protein [Metallibacterium sp.]
MPTKLNKYSKTYINQGGTGGTAIQNALGGFGVIGQPNFTTAASALSINGLYNPDGLIFDNSGNLYIGDVNNNRILQFQPPFLNDMPASMVIGQQDFTSNSNTPITDSSLYNAGGGTFDIFGNAWVSDAGNNRILMYKYPFTTGMVANLVIGQSNFTTGTANTTINGLYQPVGSAFDPFGNLWVCDSDNDRILMFGSFDIITSTDIPVIHLNGYFFNGMPASLVIGQPNFTTNIANNGGLSASSLFIPGNIVIKLINENICIFVTDMGNNRILQYTIPYTRDYTVSGILLNSIDFAMQNGGSAYMDNASYGNLPSSYIYPAIGSWNADVVLGQSSFTTSASATTQNGLYLYNTFISRGLGGISLDSSNNLYIADAFNSRILMYSYNNGFANGQNASLVLGQSSYATNTSGTTQNNLYYPNYATLDSNENLWVVDLYNNRILVYFPPFSNGMNAGWSSSSSFGTNTTSSFASQNTVYWWNGNRQNIFYGN